MTAGQTKTDGVSKKILLLGTLGPLDSGPARVYTSLLKSAFTKKFNVRFVDVRLTHEISDFETVRPGKFLLLLRHIFNIFYRLTRERYDAACVPIATNRNAFVKDALFLWLAVLFRVPVVVFEHGTGIPALYGRSGRLMRWFMKGTLGRANLCIVLADRLKFNFEPFISAQRIASVHLGIDPISSEKQTSGAADTGPLTILYLSTLRPVKGVDVFLMALAKVLSEENNLRCVLAGGWGHDAKELKPWIDQFVHDEHLEKIVSFVGPVGDERKVELLSQAHIFVFPSRVDSYGIVLLEAMRSGVPIVSTNVGAIPEIVKDGTNGLICQEGNPDDLAEKILYLVRRPELRQQMRRNNIARFSDFFTVDHFAARMIETFESALVTGQSPSELQ